MNNTSTQHESEAQYGPLSDFGRTRVSEFAKKKSEQIDEQADRWRYYLYLGLDLLKLGALLATAFGIAGSLFLLTFEFVGEIVMNVMIIIGAALVQKAIENDAIPL